MGSRLASAAVTTSASGTVAAAVRFGVDSGSFDPFASLAVRTEAWFVDETVDLGDAVALRSPSSPTYRWGNLLVLRAPPEPAARAGLETRFAAAFADLAEVRHATFAWSGADGAIREFTDAGYEGDANVVRAATARHLAAPHAAPAGFAVRRVASEEDWRSVETMQVEDRDADEPLEGYRAFRRDRNALYRAIDRGERPDLAGGWYLATIDGVPAGSMGVYVRGGLGRFQFVLVASAFRRRGVATAMVRAVAREGFERFGAARLVIMGDEGTPADGIYARAGFEPVERYVGVCAKDLALVRAPADPSSARSSGPPSPNV